MNRDMVRRQAAEVEAGNYFEEDKQWARVAVNLLDELERTEVRLEECRKARKEGY